MRFPRKLTLLICSCVVVLTVLCLIQYHLVRNTYRLEQAAYFQQIERRLSVKTQALSDSLNQKVMQALLNSLQDQLQHGLQPTLAGFQQQVNQDMGHYRRSIAQALQKDSLLRNVGYSLQYSRIVLYRGAKIDTLLKPGQMPLLLSGKGGGTFPISEGKQQVGFQVPTRNSKVQPEFYRLVVWNRPMVSISDWEQTVLKRMYATLAGSIILILVLIFIIFLIFSALLRQKKIAEVTTDFANNMTHELKTPLTAAALVVKSLRTPEAKIDEQWFEELLEQLDRQHGKIRRLMDHVLTSALDNPIGVVQLRQFNIKRLLEDLPLLATAANRQLMVSGKTELIICTDPDLLTAILSNLLDNALKYTHSASALSLNIREISSESIMISLEDHGPGIEKKYQRYLFQKFFRVPRSGTGQIKGLGLGLYICRIQAQQLGGKLSYERNNNDGSTFNLTLPHGKNADTAC